MSWYAWKPYVPVHKRRAQAAAYASRLAKKERRTLVPIRIEGRGIASSFWGQAWCDNLESYSDYANRLPRGRTYVRNGSVIDLQVHSGRVKAIVSGSEIYHVTVKIKTLPAAAWKCIQRDCASSIHSLIDLLQGRFDAGVMQRLTRTEDGLFPRPREIQMDCSCPDWAGMCKHVAAVLYGVGARLDAAPELLFTLRNVDHLDLVAKAVAAENLERSLGGPADAALAGSNLGEMFGIELESSAAPTKKPRRGKRPVAAQPAATVDQPAEPNARPAAAGPRRRKRSGGRPWATVELGRRRSETTSRRRRQAAK
jgi:uncharacterized Zn finger protein